MGKKLPDHIRDILAKDVGLKLLSIVLAAVLWLLVVNLDDPTQSRNFTATVTFENEDVLTDAGKYYELPDGNTVTFRVTARRSVIEDLSGSDFTVTADMNDLEDDTRIPVSIDVNRHANQVSISAKTHYIHVQVGTKAQNTFTVKPYITGAPLSGYAVGNVSVTPSTISVDGPSELVSTIESVSVNYDVTGMSEDTYEMVTPVFYDADGEEVDTTELVLSANSVEIFVQIQSIKDVPILVETSGQLADGLELDEITTDPEKLQLIGDADTINSMTAITIPGDVIDLSKITNNYETTVDISSYLPEGVSVAEDDQVVSINVTLLSEETKEFQIKTANLTVQNLGENLQAKFTNESVTVSITGMPSKLSGLQESGITGYVDASGLAAGTHAVGVVLDLGDGLEASAASTELELTESSE